MTVLKGISEFFENLHRDLLDSNNFIQTDTRNTSFRKASEKPLSVVVDKRKYSPKSLRTVMTKPNRVASFQLDLWIRVVMTCQPHSQGLSSSSTSFLTSFPTSFPGSLFSRSRGREEERPWKRGARRSISRYTPSWSTLIKIKFARHPQKIEI